jgi:riboflavin synthase
VFTGIVEERGGVISLESTGDSAILAVRGPLVTQGLCAHESVAVNGCCLTVVEVRADEGVFTADVMAETLARTTVGTLRAGQAVNLERPVPVGGRLGGHLVQGHVDGTGAVLRRESTPRWDLLDVALSEDLARYVAEKGSIAVDGVSLTVVGVRDDPSPAFSVALIPTTLALTTLGLVGPGDRVNLEVDVVAKYIERLGERARAVDGGAGGGGSEEPNATGDTERLDVLAGDGRQR